MNDKVYLVIEDPGSLTQLIRGAARNGYLRRLDLRDVVEWMRTVEYPIHVPVDLDSVMATGANPVVKGIFGKSIDELITKLVSEAMAKAG